MAKKNASDHSPELIARYDKLVQTIPGLERKGAASPYTSLNGHMFSYVSKEGKLALRLPKESIDDFLKKHKTKLQEAYGIVQKEYVVVPDALFKNTKELKKYFAESYHHIAALKPKPTTKSKPKKGK
ncbi:MAG: hypothetical protein ACHQM6_01430 [Candidatus Kapaibacterium sp.]